MDPLIIEINRQIAELQAKFAQLVDAVNRALSWVPWGMGWVVDGIRVACERLEREWNDFWAGVEFVFQNLGDVGLLRATHDRWGEEVGSPVSAQVGLVDRALLQADDHWTGQAAAAYFPKSLQHKTALAGVQDLADSAASALDSARGGLIKFYVGVGLALVALLGGLVTALLATGTIVGIPAALVAATVACTAAAGAITGGVFLLRSDCTTAQGTLSRALSDLGAFPGGAWPPGAILTA